MITHIYNPSQEELEFSDRLHAVDTNTVVKEGREFNLKWFMQYHPENGLADYVIIVNDDKGNEVNRFEMTIYFVKFEELKEMLESQGFRNIRAYCGFNYEEYNEFCQEVVVVAEK